MEHLLSWLPLQVGLLCIIGKKSYYSNKCAMTLTKGVEKFIFIFNVSSRKTESVITYTTIRQLIIKNAKSNLQKQNSTSNPTFFPSNTLLKFEQNEFLWSDRNIPKIIHRLLTHQPRNHTSILCPLISTVFVHWAAAPERWLISTDKHYMGKTGRAHAKETCNRLQL
jgi:hypothetical protein